MIGLDAAGKTSILTVQLITIRLHNNIRAVACSYNMHDGML